MQPKDAVCVVCTFFVLSVVTANSQAEDTEISPRKALFGDLHMHTALSFDAYAMGTRAGPDEAYRYAKGEPLKHPLGTTYQLSRPLDFLAVTDHGLFLGVLNQMADPNSPLSKSQLASELNSADPDVRDSARDSLFKSWEMGHEPEEIAEAGPHDAWNHVIEAANRHYQPGSFTTFIGYEWSATPEDQNLHRNVIFGGGTAPSAPFTYAHSPYPEDLWAWMDKARAEGHELLAIPHNPNLSNGRMFEQVDSWGKPITPLYAAHRVRNEPLVEVTQAKGTSETHPVLSPGDEFADFELMETFLGTDKPLDRFKGGYVRDALRTGLELKEEIGANPYLFGLIGSTDSHVCMGPFQENNYFSTTASRGGTAESRMASPAPGAMDRRKLGASGLTGVWAEENTRESIFDALMRKEAWATTGPRIQLRFFGGWDMSGVAPGQEGWVRAAYHAGISMGGTLMPTIDGGTVAPTFVIWALKDAEGANLDRVQIVKGWIDEGKSHEKVFDLALSDGRVVGSHTGEVLTVDNTVNASSPKYGDVTGDIQLSVVWTDREFHPAQSAFYYVRVLEVPTPRWTTLDIRKIGIAAPAGLPLTIQERAYSSPIWYDAVR